MRNTGKVNKKTAEHPSLGKIIWQAGKKDFLWGAPWLPIYSLAEMTLALLTSMLLQLVFTDTARIKPVSLLPHKFHDLPYFQQTLSKADLIFIIPSLIVLVSFVKMLSSFISSYLTERAGHQVAHTLREKMLHGFLSSPGNTIDHVNSDSLANQLMQDTALLQGALSKGTIGALRDFIVLVSMVAVMLFLSWQTFFFGLGVIVPLFFLLKKLAKKLNEYTREGQKKQVELSTRALLTANGALTVHALRSQAREAEDFAELNEANYQLMKKSLFVRTFFSPAFEFLATFILGIVFVWKMHSIGAFQASTYSTMLILIAFSVRYIKNIAGTVTFFSEIKVVLQRIQTSLVESVRSASLKKRETRTLPNDSTWALVAQEISYTSPDGQKILQNCSVKIEKGSKVAFFGKSGAGKTTFLRTLAGLIIPQTGEIELPPSRFLFASQFPYVFRGNVKENIIYAEENIDPLKADERCKELVLALVLAYSELGANLFLNKQLGFLGEGLSGGEKARVALARTLFVAPKLLLLDEPTANLDSQSSKLFWQAIDKWQAQDPEHTVIAVSHMVSEVTHFDLCFVFEEGRIVKQGRPQDIFVRD